MPIAQGESQDNNLENFETCNVLSWNIDQLQTVSRSIFSNWKISINFLKMLTGAKFRQIPAAASRSFLSGVPHLSKTTPRCFWRLGKNGIFLVTHFSNHTTLPLSNRVTKYDQSLEHHYSNYIHHKSLEHYNRAEKLPYHCNWVTKYRVFLLGYWPFCCCFKRTTSQ